MCVRSKIKTYYVTIMPQENSSVAQRISEVHKRWPIKGVSQSGGLNSASTLKNGFNWLRR